MIENFLLVAIIGLQIAIFLYLRRMARNLGTKATTQHQRVLSELKYLRASTSNSLLNQVLPATDGLRDFNWDHVIALTSYGARLQTLELALRGILKQRLVPKKVFLLLAQQDFDSLPSSVKELANSSNIEIQITEDLGPGKKLIPILASHPNLPIITFDDDLIYPTDLTLRLMIQHHLNPDCIIANRVHKVKYLENGAPAPYETWERNYSLGDGPDLNFLATSGAGTLFKAEHFHSDVLDSEAYKNLSFYTDDLWWFVQSRRVGTKVKRLPGISELNYIEGTQDEGLWLSGNQTRNDENLAKLWSKYF